MNVIFCYPLQLCSTELLGIPNLNLLGVKIICTDFMFLIFWDKHKMRHKTFENILLYLTSLFRAWNNNRYLGLNLWFDKS